MTRWKTILGQKVPVHWTYGWLPIFPFNSFFNLCRERLHSLYLSNFLFEEDSQYILNSTQSYAQITNQNRWNEDTLGFISWSVITICLRIPYFSDNTLLSLLTYSVLLTRLNYIIISLTCAINWLNFSWLHASFYLLWCSS